VVPPSRATLAEVPAAVDLHPADLLARERQGLGVAKPVSVGLRALGGHEHVVAELDLPLELERLDQLGVWPASCSLR
jgi:hypothetical protein